MDDECNSGMPSEQSLLTFQSDSKNVGEKRGSTHLEDKQDFARKPVKMRNFESGVRSKTAIATEAITHNLEFGNNKENNVQWLFGDKEESQITVVPVTLSIGASQEEQTGKNTFPAEVNLVPRPLDLNTEACGARDSSLDKSGGYFENLTKIHSYEKKEREQHSNFVKPRGINVDLNAEDVSSSINLEPGNSHKRHGRFKSNDVSESGSCTGPLEEKDSMRIWKEMKQNGFVSSSHGGIPVPKQRGKKSKNDILKRKMELAKKEEIDKFTKMAAPSGLLNELNPAIINHVRNKKQVHAIIQAYSSNGSKQAAHQMDRSVQVSKSDIESKTGVGKQETVYRSLESRQARKCPMTMNGSSLISEGKVCDRDQCTVEKASLKSCCVPQLSHAKEDDILALKLSSSTKASMSSTTLSNEESSNFTMVSSLSLKAATVASQWLELLHEDIKGRLTALRRSRKRVRSVIATELPFLISKEFENNQDNEPFAMKMSAGLPTSKTADLHRARWSALFNHMDGALLEEEKQLESWFKQVKEKQLLCQQGLHNVNWSTAYGLQQMGTSENKSRRVSVLDSSEKELAVNAAAASIYSTCNFLLSQS